MTTYSLVSSPYSLPLFLRNYSLLLEESFWRSDFFFFFDKKGEVLFNYITEFIHPQPYPASRDIFYYSLSLPYTLQNTDTPNCDKYRRFSKVVIGGFPVSLIHQCIRLLHGRHGTPGPPMSAL